MLILTLVRPDLSLSSLQLKTKGFGSKDKTMCSFWLNTSFLEDGITVLSKPEIDKCHQDMKKHAKFDRNFQITLRHTDKEPEDFRERATGGPRRRALGAPSQPCRHLTWKSLALGLVAAVLVWIIRLQMN